MFPLSFIFHLPRDSPTSLRLRQRRPATRWHRACPRRPNQPSESAPALETRTRLSSSIHAAIAGAARLLALLEMVAPASCLPSARLVALPQTSCLPLTRAGPFLRRRGCDVNAPLGLWWRRWSVRAAADLTTERIAPSFLRLRCSWSRCLLPCVLSNAKPYDSSLVSSRSRRATACLVNRGCDLVCLCFTASVTLSTMSCRSLIFARTRCRVEA